MVTTLANRAKSTRKILKYEIKYKAIMAKKKNWRRSDPAIFANAQTQTVPVTESPPLPKSLGRQIPQTSRSEG